MSARKNNFSMSCCQLDGAHPGSWAASHGRVGAWTHAATHLRSPTSRPSPSAALRSSRVYRHVRTLSSLNGKPNAPYASEAHPPQISLSPRLPPCQPYLGHRSADSGKCCQSLQRTPQMDLPSPVPLWMGQDGSAHKHRDAAHPALCVAPAHVVGACASPTGLRKLTV